MHNKPETLGDVIKSAREKSDYTVEQLAEKIGISERYLYKIENEGKKPSYDVLYKLIRSLSIAPEKIFYPDRQITNTEIDNLLFLLSLCDERSLNIVKATTIALINSSL